MTRTIELDPPICEFCGCYITDSDQQCAAQDEGRCYPMSRDGPRFDWEGLFWETRGYLGLDDDAPVPLDELRETAEANGWSEREFREAHRGTDGLVNVGTLDEPRVVLDATVAETDDEHSDTGDDTPGIEIEN